MFKVTFSKITDVIAFVENFKALPRFSQCDSDESWGFLCRFKDLAGDSSNIVLKTTKDFYTDNNGHELEQIVINTMDSCISTWELVSTSGYGVHRSNWLKSLDDSSTEDKELVMSLVTTVSLMRQCRDIYNLIK